MQCRCECCDSAATACVQAWLAAGGAHDSDWKHALAQVLPLANGTEEAQYSLNNASHYCFAGPATPTYSVLLQSLAAKGGAASNEGMGNVIGRHSLASAGRIGRCIAGFGISFLAGA